MIIHQCHFQCGQCPVCGRLETEPKGIDILHLSTRDHMAIAALRDTLSVGLRLIVFAIILAAFIVGFCMFLR